MYGIFTYMKTIKINHENVGKYDTSQSHVDPSWDCTKKVLLQNQLQDVLFEK